MNARPRIALVGCGRIGQVHLRSLLSMPDLADLRTIVDVHEPSVRQAAETFGIDHWSTDVDAVMADPEIDAVIIASSTDTHGPFISAAAMHGKHAFTEKPIALDLETTDRALADVRTAGTRLQIGFQRRFDAGYARVKQQIVDGSIGAIEFIRDAMRDPEPPTMSYAKGSGGLYRDMAIHNFDCVRWLMGAEPVEIFATGSVLVEPELSTIDDVDTSVVTMRFADGALATIENSRRSGFGYDVRTEVFGSRGAAMIGESRATPVRLYSDGVREDHQYFFLDRFADAFRAEIAAFVTAIRDDRPIDVTGEDGRAALVLAIAAEHSRKARAPIAIASIDPGERKLHALD
jgi:myo-inositol 2-dehydrogenase/D-chiro-inositol 1-dehydrogenase